MDEEILLKRRLIDTANKAYRQNIYTYTNFFSMSELDTYYRALPELSFIHSEAFGGSASCERQIVRFGSPDDFGFDEPYPDRKSTRLNSSHVALSRMPSSA